SYGGGSTLSTSTSCWARWPRGAPCSVRSARRRTRPLRSRTRRAHSRFRTPNANRGKPSVHGGERIAATAQHERFEPDAVGERRRAEADDVCSGVAVLEL